MKGKHITKLLLVVLVGISQLATAQTVQSIIEKHIAAMGGEKLDSLTSVIMEGTLTVSGVEVPMTRYVLHNQGQRFDVVVMNVKGFVLVTNGKGWNYYPFFGMKNPVPMKEEEVQAYLPSIDLQGELYKYKEKGHTVSYEGLEEQEGFTCYKLNVALKSGVNIVEYIDTASNYIIKTIVPGYVNGKTTLMENRYGNYKKIEGGYIFPLTMTLGPGKAFITKIVVNPTIEPQKFQISEK